MIKRSAVLLIFTFLFNLFGCGWADVNAGAPNSSGYVVSDNIVEEQYKLGPGDEVAANLIIGENDMSLDNTFFIGPDGKIFFPKVGEIKLLGLTIPEAKKKVDDQIRQTYKEKYEFSFRLVQPRKVQVYLSGSEDKPLYLGEKNFVYVYGEVPKSGRFEYIPGKKFSDYISYAGGPNQRANFAASSITRGQKKMQVNGVDVIFNGDTTRDIEIMPGDVINVPAQFFYFSDFASFTSLIFTMLALYNTVFAR
jgi:protein involved in polysaccharide export with SLBB domain